MKKILFFVWCIMLIIPLHAVDHKEVVSFCDIGDDGHHYKDLSDEFIAYCDDLLSRIDQFPNCLRYPVDQCVNQLIPPPGDMSQLPRAEKRKVSLRYRKKYCEEKERQELLKKRNLQAFEEVALLLDKHLESEGVYLFVDKKNKVLRFFFTDAFKNLNHRFAYFLPSGTKVYSYEVVDFQSNILTPSQKPQINSLAHATESTDGGLEGQGNDLPAYYEENSISENAEVIEDHRNDDVEHVVNFRPRSPLRIEYNPNAFLVGRNITGKKRVFDEIDRSSCPDRE